MGPGFGQWRLGYRPGAAEHELAPPGDWPQTCTQNSPRNTVYELWVQGANGTVTAKKNCQKALKQRKTMLHAMALPPSASLIVEQSQDFEKNGLHLHFHEYPNNLDGHNISDLMQIEFVSETDIGSVDVDYQMTVPSISSQSIFEPLRMCTDKSPPKRFHRTLWRSITRRMLTSK